MSRLYKKVPPRIPRLPGMSVVLATLEASPGSETFVSSLLVQLVGPTSKEAGTICYVVHVDPNHRGRFVVYERYRDDESLDAHLSAAWLASELKKLEGHLLAPPQVLRLQPLAAFDRATAK